MGPLLLFRDSSSPYLARGCWWWLGPRLDPLVGTWPPGSSSLHGHGKGPLLSSEGLPLLASRLDGHETEPQADWTDRHF